MPSKAEGGRQEPVPTPSKTPKLRTCEWCGDTFVPRVQDQDRAKFCPGKGCSRASANSKQRYGDASMAPDKATRLRRLDDLLRNKGIDLDDLEKANIKAVKFWQTAYKDNEGEGQVLDLAGITISPAWDTGPQWPVITQGKRYTVPRKTPRRRVGKGWQTAVVVPDIQIGYFRGPGDELVAIHDERAVSILVQAIGDIQPDRVIFHGDNADFVEFGRYRLTPAFARTTQATIDRCTLLGAQVRDIAPGAVQEWLEGNHEWRLPAFILDNAKAAFALKRGMEPKDWPVLSMPHLCRFDEHGVTYVPGYPANKVWINDRLKVIHGHKVNSRGSTAPRYLDDERVSTIYGHVHRREWAERTRETRDGPRTILAASFGCLCRLDGSVPSTKGGSDLEGQPVQVVEDWQQGFGVVHYKAGDGDFYIEPVSIFDGRSRYRDTEYRG